MILFLWFWRWLIYILCHCFFTKLPNFLPLEKCMPLIWPPPLLFPEFPLFKEFGCNMQSASQEVQFIFNMLLLSPLGMLFHLNKLESIWTFVWFVHKMVEIGPVFLVNKSFKVVNIFSPYKLLSLNWELEGDRSSMNLALCQLVLDKRNVFLSSCHYYSF